jgi:hypothetical protein
MCAANFRLPETETKIAFVTNPSSSQSVASNMRAIYLDDRRRFEFLSYATMTIPAKIFELVAASQSYEWGTYYLH